MGRFVDRRVRLVWEFEVVWRIAGPMAAPFTLTLALSHQGRGDLMIASREDVMCCCASF